MKFTFLFIFSLSFFAVQATKPSISSYYADKSLDCIANGDLKNSELYSDSLMQLAYNEADTIFVIEWLSRKGSKETYSGYVDIAEKTALLGLQLSQSIHDTVWECKMLLALNLVFRFREEPMKSITYLQRALKLAKISNNSKLQGNIYSSFNVLYKETGNQVLGNLYLDSALVISLEYGYHNLTASIYGSKARKVANDKEKAREAIGYIHEALKYEKLDNDTSIYHGYYQTLGLAYTSLGQYDSAIFCLTKSLELKQQIGHKQGAVFAMNRLGDVYEKIGDTEKAKTLYLQSLEIATEIDRPRSKTGALKLYKIYKREKNFEAALEMFEIYKTSSDRIKNEVFKRNSIQQEYEMAYAQQAFQDSLVQNEAQLKIEFAHQEELLKKNRIRNYLIGLGLFLLLVAGGGWSRAQFIKRANAKLEVERNRAEESERFKQRFLANMSHEIRTPMNAVLGMTELTLDTKLTKKQKVYLDAIKNSSENLLVIINDILDLSKLEQGKLTIEKIPFRLKEQLSLVEQTLKFKAEEKGLILEVNIDDKISEVVLGDPSRLHQVLMNLTSNAIKFTERGKVSLLVNKKSGDHIQFMVRDTGIGIPKDKQDMLFQSFQQVDESTSRKYGGTGLGLAISKDLVELQGGTISVESEEGKGATFSFTLKLASSTMNAQKSNKEFEADVLSGIKILVAEDNMYNQIVIQDTLENMIDKAEVTLVENGQLAVDKLMNDEFDVILMDAHMPVLDGVGATKLIRKNLEKPKRDIPIISLTASVLNEEIEHCLNAGMNDALPKPFKRPDLLRVLGKYYQSEQS